MDSESLRRFLNEELGESEEARVQDHVGACSACQAQLESVAGQPELWSGLREHLGVGAGDDAPGREAGGDLDSLVELLDPTDDPQRMGRLGGYEVCGLIGRGGTGIVMKAFEPRLNRYVAIKLMSPTYSSNGSARSRFEREGRAVAAVLHENVVPIYAVDDHRGLPYIVMQYIPGLSLEQRIERDGPLDTRAVTRVALQVARGLEAAHAQGIVHRDVKPANVILEATVDRAMVTDFGLARVADDASLTRSGTITGTPQYMSPEQARGDGVDLRSDLFSLGSLMYAACTGHAPFRSETVYGVIHRVCKTEPRPIREVQPEIDEWLAALVAKLMSKSPSERFQSASDVVDVLAAELAYLQNPTAGSRPKRDWRRKKVDRVLGAFGGRLRLRAAALALVGLGGALFGGFAIARWSSEGNSPDSQAGVFAPHAGIALGADDLVVTGPGEEPELVEWSGLTESGRPDSSAVVFEQKRDWSLPVEGRGDCSVRVDQGSVEVVPGDPGVVRIRATRTIRAENQAAADRFASGHLVDVVQEGESLSLRAMRGEEGEAPADTGEFESIGYRIEVPSNFDLDVRTELGSVVIGAVKGNVEAETLDGSVQLGSVDGTVRARAKHGDIQLIEGCSQKADLLVVGGDVHIANVETSARIRTSNGDVFLGKCRGEIMVQTSGGDVSIAGITGRTSVHAEGGDVLLQLEETPIGSALLTAAHGDVRILVTEGVAASIEARGTLDSELPFEVQHDRRGAIALGRLSGGGAPIEASSTTGSITVAYTNVLDELGAVADLHSDGVATAIAVGQSSTEYAGGASQGLGRSARSGSVQGPGGSGGRGSGQSLGGSARGGSAQALGGSGGGGSGRSLGASARSGRVQSPGGSGGSESGQSLGGSARSGQVQGPGGSGGSGQSLGGSARGGSVQGLGGSGATESAQGLGGSDSHGVSVARAGLPDGLREKTSGDPRPGALVAVRLEEPGSVMDGYTLYLPRSHGERDAAFPILVYLQGAYGVGGEIEDLNNWGLARLVRDESDLSLERNRLLLDEFIVVSPHIQGGQYHDDALVVGEVLNDVMAKYNADRDRIYVTGLSRGGHGSWGLAAQLPGMFAALAPVGGYSDAVQDFAPLANTSVWIAHNEDDSTVPFAEASRAMEQLEGLTGERFLRTTWAEIELSDYLDSKYVLTSSPNGGHDAWTDLYSNPEFYKWLLRQSRQLPAARDEG